MHPVKLLAIICTGTVLSYPFSAVAQEMKESKTFDMDEVVITATKTGIILADVPQDIHVITPEQIARSNAQTVGDVLKYIPGLNVSLSDDAPGASTWQSTLRGLSIDDGYGLVLIDGHRVKGRGMGEYGNGLNLIPVEMIERIEVVKGPGSVLYGSDAMSGVINIITKRLTDKERFNAYANYGSKGAARQGFSYGNKSGVIGFQTSGSMERIAIDEYEGRFLSNRVNYTPAGIGSYSLDIDVNDMFSSGGKDERRVKIAPEASFDLGNGSKAVISGYWYDWDFKHSTRHGDIFYSQAEARVSRFLDDRHRLTAGSEFLRQTLEYSFKGIEGAWPELSKDIDTYSVFLQDEWSVNAKAFLTLGARYDNHSSYGGVLSPRISGLYDIGESTRFRASVGRSFKSPNIRQLYYPAPFSHGANEYILSNPELKPEYAFGYTISLEKNFRKTLFATGMVYRNDLEDMVAVYDTGLGYAGKNLLSYENVSRAFTRGIECEVRFQMPGGVSGTLSFDYTDSKNKDTGKKVRYVPKHSEGVRVSYFNSRLGFGINWGVKYVGSFYTDVENTKKNDGYSMAEAKILKYITNLMSLSLEGNNLFDTDYGDPSSERMDRTYTVRLNLKN